MPDQFLNFTSFFRALRTYPLTQIATEMLIIGLAVFWVMRFLRGTRGARMLKGIATVLIGLYIVVRVLGTQFGLQRIDFLYGKFLGFATFAVVVVFQPELRRAVMRLGENRFFGAWSHQIDEEIEALVESAVFCSRRKIGALIAIERELGSRHRAAVGMSQESDAVVLVVSEETGDISIAERGRLIRKLTPEGLRGLLLELLGRGEGSSFRQAA